MTKYSNAPFLLLEDSLVKDHMAYTMNYNLTFEGGKVQHGKHVVQTSPTQKKLIEATYERDVRLLDQTKRPYQRLEVMGEGHFLSGLGAPHASEAGLLIHTVYGVPYLNASSIKGMVRDWAKVAEVGKDTIDRLFGTTESSGVIQFGDIVFSNVTLEPDIMTPHYGKYYAGNAATDTDLPIPIRFFSVKVNEPAQLLVATSLRATEEELDLAVECLVLAFREFGYGAKTTSGYGRFFIKKEEESVREQRMKAIEQQTLHAEELAIAEKQRLEEAEALMQRVSHLSQDDQQVVLLLFQELQTALSENKQELVDALKAKEKIEIATRFPKEVGIVYREFAQRFDFWKKPSKKLAERLKPLKRVLEGIPE